MKILKLIRPEKPLKELKWFDIAIVTAIMFGQFIVWSTELFLASLQPVAQTVTAATETARDGAAYSSNFTLQIILLALALAYLLLRNFDFKQLPIRFKWSVLFWVPLIFAIVGLFGDIVTTVSGEYDYFNINLLSYIDPMQIITSS